METGEVRKVLVGDLRERVHLEDIEIDGMIILRWILSKWDEEAWNGLVWLERWTSGGRK
jgi:hypothetical protein